jgi:hypothetical protein
MRLLLNPHAAPSAALPGGAANPPAPGASSAPDFTTKPINPAEFHRALAASMAAAETPPTPAPAPAIESPAGVASAPVPPAVPADPGAAAPAAPVPVAEDPDAEPSAEVLASLSESGQRALQAERSKRKEARAELAAAKTEIEQLKAQLQPPAAPAAPQPAAPGQPPVPAPAPSAPPTELARCETFEAVDACAMQAITTEAMAMQLNTVLATEGLTAAVEQLRAHGVEKFRGVPLDDLTAADLAGNLSATMRSSREIQMQAHNRKTQIALVGRNFGEAVSLLPALKDPKSAVALEFQAIVAANPRIKELGPNWPVLVANQLIATETIKARTKPPTPPAPVLTPAPAPAALPSGPAAPRTSAATLRTPNEMEALSAKINSGKATKEEVRQYTRLSLAQG